MYLLTLIDKYILMNCFVGGRLLPKIQWGLVRRTPKGDKKTLDSENALPPRRPTGKGAMTIKRFFALDA